MAAVDGHAQEPGFQVLLAGELCRVLGEPQEHVLVDVLSIFLGARLRQGEPPDRAAPGGHGLPDERIRPEGAPAGTFFFSSHVFTSCP